MDNVFVIESVSTGRFYAKEIAWRGYNPVVIYPYMENQTETYKQYRKSGSEYAANFTDDIIFMQSGSEAEYEGLLEKYKPVAVVAGSEMGVSVADRLSKKLGLPGNDPATTECRRNKFGMVKALQKAGVPAICSEVVSSAEECLELAQQWNSWPVVIKPLSGAGTKGVHFCSTPEELAVQAKEVLGEDDFFGKANSTLLMQELAKGTEFIVNTVSYKGRHAVTDVWRYCKIAIGDRGNAYDYAKLVTQPDEDEKSVIAYALEAITAMGFEYGPSHTEIMLTERGPLLIETGARPMGAVHDIDALRESLGHIIVDAALDTYIDPAAAEAFLQKPYQPVKTIMTKVFISKESAVLKELPLLNLLKFLPAARKGDFDVVKSTMEVSETVDLQTAPGELQLCGTEAEVMHDYKALRAFEEQAFDLIFAKEIHSFAAPKVKVRLPDSGEWQELALSVRKDGTILWKDLIEDLGSLAFGMSEGMLLEFTEVADNLRTGLSLLLKALYFKATAPDLWCKTRA